MARYTFLFLMLLGTALAQQSLEETHEEASNSDPKECMFPERWEFPRKMDARRYQPPKEMRVNNSLEGKAVSFGADTGEASSTVCQIDCKSTPAKKAFFAPADFTQDHFSSALEKYPDTDRLIVKENARREIVIAPAFWGREYLSFEIRSLGDKQTIRALSRYLYQNYGGEIARQSLPLLQERIAIDYPLSAATLKRILLHAHLLSHNEEISSYLIENRALPSEGERLFYASSATQDEYVAQALKEKADKLQKEANKVIANIESN